jgi:hypothetical protein
METNPEEKILHTTDFSAHLWSASFFFTPILVLISAIFFLSTFAYLALEQIRQKSYFFAILLSVFALIGLAITIAGLSFLYAAFRDAYEGKVKVRTVQVENFTNYKNSLSLHYTFQGKPASTMLPNRWQIKGKLPQKAILYISYHTNQLLQLELLESKEFFSRRNSL